MKAPTSAEINALPQPLRRYIHDLETRCDPAGDYRELIERRDQVAALELRVAELERGAEKPLPSLPNRHSVRAKGGAA